MSTTNDQLRQYIGEAFPDFDVIDIEGVGAQLSPFKVTIRDRFTGKMVSVNTSMSITQLAAALRAKVDEFGGRPLRGVADDEGPLRENVVFPVPGKGRWHADNPEDPNRIADSAYSWDVNRQSAHPQGYKPNGPLAFQPGVNGGKPIGPESYDGNPFNDPDPREEFSKVVKQQFEAEVDEALMAEPDDRLAVAKTVDEDGFVVDAEFIEDAPKDYSPVESEALKEALHLKTEQLREYDD